MAASEATKERPLAVPRKVREWARLQGHDVGERGRIPAPLIAAYREAVIKRSN